MIKARDVSYGYAHGILFDKVSFTVAKNQKVGLVGPNGAGKSTLFKLITGGDSPSSGTLEIVGSVNMVPQEVKHDPFLEKSSSIKHYIDPETKHQDFELLEMLRGLEFEVSDLHSKPQHLSGGQKTKLALVRALISEPDILLLDEPTNFLDEAGKKWVMEFLSHYPKTLIIISHDLELMDQHIDKVIAINSQTKKLEEYGGNYLKYLKLKKERDDLLKRQILNQQKHIKRMEKGLKKMARMTSKKGVRARTMQRHRIEKMKQNLPELPKEIAKIKISLPDPAPVGELPIRAIDISKSYGDKTVLEDVSFSIQRGERVALIGPNGAGKSTFIKILVGMLSADSGEVVRDTRLKLGYYSQEFETFDMDKTVIELVGDVSNLPDFKIRPFLGRFMFGETRINQKVSTLSGGEKTRLAIALLMLQDSNLLILDEPTTYLDVMSQRVILDALKGYRGAMLIVSHTEEFVEELMPNRVLLFPENKIEFWLPEMIEKVGIIDPV